MNKIITVKGGIVWGWVIREKYNVFEVVGENNFFYKVVPIKGATKDFNSYNKLLKNRKALLVPRYCIY